MPHPVFLALARPPMCYGVTQGYLLFISATHLIGFVVTNCFYWLLLWLLCYGVGRCVCRFDPHGFNILFGYWQHLPRHTNWRYFGCVTYELPKRVSLSW